MRLHVILILIHVATALLPNDTSEFFIQYVERMNVKNTLIFRISQEVTWNRLAEQLFYGLTKNFGSYATISKKIEISTAFNTSVATDDHLLCILVKNVLPRTLIVAPLLSDMHAKFLKLVMEPETTVDYQWLLLADDNFPDLLQDIYLPLINKVTIATMNNQEITLWEVYQFDRMYKQKVVRVGKWMPLVKNKTGGISKSPKQPQGILETPDPDVIPRRSNLTGFNIRCSYLEYLPHNIREIKGNQIIYTGISDSVWLELQKQLNFSVKCHEPQDKMYGTHTDGKWNGIIADLVNDRADVSFTLLSMTSPRASVVDFTVGFYKDRWVIAVQKSRNMGSVWMSYVNEFSWRSWAVTAAVVPVTAFCLFLTIKFSPTESTKISVAETFSLVLGSMACQGWWIDLRSPSTRLVLATTMITMVLLYYHYSACLTSALAASSLGLPFSNIFGFYNARDDYKLVTLKGSAYQGMFKLGQDTLLHKIWDDMIAPYPGNMVESSIEGIRAVKSGLTGYSTAEEVFKYKTNYDCGIDFIPVQLNHQIRAFATRKGIFISKVFDKVLLKMMSSGVSQRYQQQFVKPMTCNFNELEVFGFEKVMTAFVLLGSGILLACLLVLIERMLHASKNK